MRSVERLHRLAWVLAVVVAFFLGMAFAPHDSVVAQMMNKVLTETEQSFARVYDTVSPSVVSISVQQRIGSDFLDYSSGSGFVVDKRGYLATNYHVVDGGDRIIVNFFDGTISLAEVVGIDPDADIAVLEVDLPEDRLFPVTFGDSDTLTVGQTALAIGSPFGQRWTLTSGIISALDRAIEGLATFNTGAVIQTDTAINPGNSGGPLVNLDGEVIGVNTQILSEVRANSGVGFAVPSNLVRRVINQLIQTGEMTYSYLGISGEDVRYDDIERLGLPNNVRGVVVSVVRRGDPAELGGLQFDDVIVSIDDRPIIGFASLLGYLSINTAPNDIVRITVLRNGEPVTLEVTLGARTR